MRPQDVRMCCRLGVDICGFVVEYPVEVPWNLTMEQCAQILPLVTPPATSCIVTGGESSRIIQLALELRPDYVQLHYHEKLEDVISIVHTLSPHGIGVIKTIPDSAEDRLQQFGTDDPVSCARSLAEAGVAMILVDSRGPSNAASTGTAADLSLFKKTRDAVDCPVMLGGGITAENCREIISNIHPDVIDVMSGVESSPGEKSPALVSALVRYAR